MDQHRVFPGDLLGDNVVLNGHRTSLLKESPDFLCWPIRSIRRIEERADHKGAVGGSPVWPTATQRVKHAGAFRATVDGKYTRLAPTPRRLRLSPRAGLRGDVFQKLLPAPDGPTRPQTTGRLRESHRLVQ